MSLPTWKVCGASVQGTSHQEQGLPCQDAHGFRILQDGGVAIAVSDGAGSAEFAEVASVLCVRVALEQVAAAPSPMPDQSADWMQTVFAGVHVALEACANQRQAPLRKFAATLTVVLLTDRGAAQGAVGDSGAIFRMEDGSLSTLCLPRKGEYVNETDFLSDPTWGDAFQTKHADQRVTGFMVATDGILDVILRGNRIDENVVRSLLEFTSGITEEHSAGETLAVFLQSPRVTRRVDDDLTLVLGSRMETLPP